MAPYRNTRSGSSKCHLFELSPELRNTIYRLALVSNNTIEVGAADAPPMDPPLLMTCRQIRREARGIYYQENAMNFTTLDYDVRKIVTWLDRSPAHHDLYANARLTLSVTNQYTICWYNLHNWTYMYRKGRITRLTLASSSLATGRDSIHATNSDRRQASGLFDVAEAHLAAGSDPHTSHVAREQYRQSSMSPDPVRHKIWWNNLDPPTPLPTLEVQRLSMNTTIRALWGLMP